MDDLAITNTSTSIDQDYKVSVIKFSPKDAIKDNCDKIIDIRLMTMKVHISNTFYSSLMEEECFDISTKLQGNACRTSGACFVKFHNKK